MSKYWSVIKSEKSHVESRFVHNLRYEAKHLNKQTAELSTWRQNSADKRSKSPRRLLNCFKRIASNLNWMSRDPRPRWTGSETLLGSTLGRTLRSCVVMSCQSLFSVFVILARVRRHIETCRFAALLLNSVINDAVSCWCDTARCYTDNTVRSVEWDCWGKIEVPTGR
jgi:hypothetical protein